MDRIKKLKILIIPGIVLFVDQITKFIVKKTFVLGESVEIIGNTVCLTYIENTGMAFGIKIGYTTFFTILSIFLTIFIFYYLHKIKEKNLIYRFPFSLILGGALGNLIDRIVYRKVIDFIDVDIPNISIASFDLFLFRTPEIELFRWPIFNVADIAITIGIIFLLGLFYFKKDLFETKNVEVTDKS